MPAPARRRVLACRPATVAIVPRRQIAVAALGRLRSGLRRPRRSHSPRGAQARQRPSTPEQKTGARMLFPALDFRKHLASAVSLVTIDTGGERFGFFLPSIDVPEGQTAHFHTVGVYKMFSGPNSIPHRPSTWRCIELGGTAQTVIVPEGLTSEIVGFLGIHNKWLVDLDSNQDSRSQSPDCLGEFASRFCKLSSQAARFCQRVAANLQTENPCVTRRLNTGRLVESGARKQTLRFAVCEPWSVCDPSVSFLSATISP